MNYQTYLRSEHWKEPKKRFRASRLHKHCCYVCGTRYGLQVHHKSYRRIGNERLHDLLYLCDDCHWSVHHVLKTRGTGSTNLWSIAKKYRKIVAKRGKNDAQEWVHLACQPGCKKP